MTKFKDKTSCKNSSEGVAKFVVVGVVLFSALIASGSAAMSIYLGNSWLGTIAIYLSTGAACSVFLLLCVIANELRRQGTHVHPAIPRES